MEWPLCVSHSVQARTHASQPMHRVASMKNPMLAGTGIVPGDAVIGDPGPDADHAFRSPSLLFNLTAQTLYSGIFDIGSCAEIVNWLALWRPGQ